MPPVCAMSPPIHFGYIHMYTHTYVCTYTYTQQTCMHACTHSLKHCTVLVFLFYSNSRCLFLFPSLLPIVPSLFPHTIPLITPSLLPLTLTPPITPSLLPLTPSPPHSQPHSSHYTLTPPITPSLLPLTPSPPHSQPHSSHHTLTPPITPSLLPSHPLLLTLTLTPLSLLAQSIDNTGVLCMTIPSVLYQDLDNEVKPKLQ